nr:FAD-dependent oxidoreductase [Deltaproteobacteria bacterium]
MRNEKLLIIGGNAAGMSAASQARRRKRDGLDIIAFERGPTTSYSACGIPYYISDVIEDEDQLVVRSPEVFREKYHIDARPFHEVHAIEPQAQRILVRNFHDQKEWWEPYDELLIATGAVPIWPNLPGSEARGIYALSTLESGVEVKEFVEQNKPKRGVIVGGGSIGVEMAEALVLRGMEVAIVEQSPHIMNIYDEDIGQRIAEVLKSNGVSIYTGESLAAYEVKNGAISGAVTDKRTLPAELVIISIGVQPDTQLAREAGILLGTKDAIVVNDRMQTPTDRIWAAGDCAESFHLISRQPVYIALGTIANRQGRVAGINLGGGQARFPGVLGTAISKVFDIEFARTGLQEREVRELGLEYVSGVIKSLTHAGYYPEAGDITVKLIAEKKSGRLLGGQIIGESGSGKRIDTIATALHEGLTAEEMINVDLSYSPPYSPVWDPVATAARKVASLL